MNFNMPLGGFCFCSHRTLLESKKEKYTLLMYHHSEYSIMYPLGSYNNNHPKIAGTWVCFWHTLDVHCVSAGVRRHYEAQDAMLLVAPTKEEKEGRNHALVLKSVSLHRPAHSTGKSRSCDSSLGSGWQEIQSYCVSTRRTGLTTTSQNTSWEEKHLFLLKRKLLSKK